MSEKGKNIDDFIKAGFDQQDASFNGSGFDAISSKLSQTNKIDEAVQLSFASQGAELTDVKWDEMHDRLDLETVWHNLNDYLNYRSRVSIINVIAVLLVIIGLWMPFSIVDEQLSIPSKTVTEVGIDQSTEDEALNSSDNLIFENEDPQENQVVNELGVVVNKQPENEIAEENNSVNAKDDLDQIANIRTEQTDQMNTNIARVDENKPLTEIDYLAYLPLSKTSLIAADYSVNPSFPEIDLIKLTNERKPSFSVGLVGSVDNTWILNEDTKDGFRKNSLVINNPGFTVNYGLNAQWIGKSGLILKSNLFLKSTIVQSNQKYFKGDQVNLITESDSYRMSFLAGYSARLGSSHRQYLNASGGLYVSYLKNALVKKDSYITQTETSFNRFNSGFELELIHGFKFGSFNAGYGLISDIGFTDIVRTENSPNKSFTIGVLGTIGYSF